MKVYFCKKAAKVSKEKIITLDNHEKSYLTVLGSYENMYSLSKQLGVVPKRAKQLLLSRLHEQGLLRNYPETTNHYDYQEELDSFTADVTRCITEALDELSVGERLGFALCRHEFQDWVRDNAQRLYGNFRRQRDRQAEKEREMFVQLPNNI